MNYFVINFHITWVPELEGAAKEWYMLITYIIVGEATGGCDSNGNIWSQARYLFSLSW